MKVNMEAKPAWWDMWDIGQWAHKQPAGGVAKVEGSDVAVTHSHQGLAPVQGQQLELLEKKKIYESKEIKGKLWWWETHCKHYNNESITAFCIITYSLLRNVIISQ